MFEYFKSLFQKIDLKKINYSYIWCSLLVVGGLVLVLCNVNHYEETVDASKGHLNVQETNQGIPIDILLGENQDDVFVMGEKQTITSGDDNAHIYIYYSSRDFSHLMREEVTSISKTPENIISALAKHNIAPLDTVVKSFAVTLTEEGKVRITLNLNKKFSKYLMTMAENSEKVIMASLINSFLKNYDADEMVVLVNNQPIKTSHSYYKDPITWYYYKVEEVWNE